MDDSSPSGGNGQGWTTAYRDIQSALVDASSNAAVTEIRVAGGSYIPTQSGGGVGPSYFVTRNNLAIRGGYAGQALLSSPNLRDYVLYRSRIHVGLPSVNFEGVDRTAVLEGFFLTGSRRGIRSINASPTIRDCWIQGNSVPNPLLGGGVYCEGGQPLFINCRIQENYCFANPSSAYTQGWHGGGCYFDAGCTPTLVNCIIQGNRAGDGTNGKNTDATVDGLDGGLGGGIYSQSPNLTLVNSILAFNRAGNGGNGFSRATVNGSGGDGGHGGAIYSTSPGVRLVNCTVYANKAGLGGTHASGGSAPPGTPGSNGLYGGLFNADIENSIASANIPDNQVGGAAVFSLVGTDPRLVDPDGLDNIGGNLDDDLRLRGDSPSIDAGNNLLIVADVADLDVDGDFAERTPRDLDGAPRYQDDPPTADSGVSDPPGYVAIADIGAYEYGLGLDCNTNLTSDHLELRDGLAKDCNTNGTPDACDILTGLEADCSTNGTPDRCELDCNSNGTSDDCDIAGGFVTDCNTNGTPDGCEPDCNTNALADTCEIATGASADCNTNRTPDECDIRTGLQKDCDTNGTPDRCDILAGALDCNTNNSPDHCDIRVNPTIDCNTNGTIDRCDVLAPGSADCNTNGADDLCDISFGGQADCNLNMTPDRCEILTQPQLDCNTNTLIDSCEIAAGSQLDCNTNVKPDICDTVGGALDCNTNRTPDSCEVASGVARDCNTNHTPDVCDIRVNPQSDCNTNGSPDACDIAIGGVTDCNTNGSFDACELAAGTQRDCNTNATPDRCDILRGDPDCNTNQTPDTCDLRVGAQPDCDTNGIPDRCDVLMTADDCNTNLRPDVCDLDCNTNEEVDVCEIAALPSLDCNLNASPDVCDIASGIHPDCNTNEAIDYCEANAGAVDDCDTNVVPDECQPDCNTNGTPEACDLAAGGSDCNTNHAPDECDLAAGEGDCDLNQTPDACEIGSLFHVDSPQLSPFDFTSPQTYHLQSPPFPTGPVTITVRARSRLATTARWVDMYLGSTLIGQLFVDNGTTCPGSYNQGAIVVSAAVFDAARVGNAVDVRAVPNSAVTPPNCSGGTLVWFTVSYTFGTNRDCNTNGVPDTCDVTCGDLDFDGDVDGADFSLILLSFGRGEGHPNFNACADLDGDHVVSLIDYQRWLQCYREFIGLPNAPAPQPADMGDLNADGLIDADDIQPLVEALLGGQAGGSQPGLRTLFVADFNGDAAIGPADVPGFVERLRGVE